jgi:UDP-N-acetylglucosamine diphosphorylase/glucosamine-1-phosphate N-acetyltransferase
MDSLRFLPYTSDDLYPLTALRDVQCLHFGARSIADQWKDALLQQPKVIIHPRLLPTREAVQIVSDLEPGQTWTWQGLLLAQSEDGSAETLERDPQNAWLKDCASLFEQVELGIESDTERLQSIWRLRALGEDEREAWSARGLLVHGPMDRVLIGPGATLRDATLNTEQGVVILAPDSEIMEGCRIRGPFVLGEGSTMKMGSLVYGPTTIGKGCKVGGELSNVVIHDWSNKAHGGFLGNAVIGSWCNLGAETTCSNLKNTYGDIAEWNQAKGSFQSKSRTFCGLIMGDHSKTAIHTAFSTATVVGAFCNVYGDGTPSRHVPHFSWGQTGEDCQDLEKALSTCRKVMARRDQELSEVEEQRIRALFEKERG